MSFPRNESYQFDEFTLNRFSRTLLRGGEPVALSPKAFEVLTHLVSNPGRVLTKEELLKAVWPESFVEEGNLAQHISALRRALTDRASFIVTVPGRGYQFTAPVHMTSGRTEASSQTAFPEQGDHRVLVQTVRERTHLVLDESSPLPERRRHTNVRSLGLATAAVVIVAATAALGWKTFSPAPKFHKVMIADFLNLTGDPSMDHTLSSALGISLGQTPYLQLMGKGAEDSALVLMQKPADTPILGNVALEICRRNNFQAMLRGKIENAGEGYNLSLEEVACSTGETVIEFKANASDKDALLNTLDELGGRARKRLGEPNQSIEQFQVPLADASTFSFDALDDYNVGSRLGNAGNLAECIKYFQKAVDIDPKFAMAQANLGTAYYNLGSWDKAAEYYKKAFDLSNNVTQWEKFYIRSNYYLIQVRDLIKAVKTFEEWTQTYPNDETAWLALSNAQVQLGNYQAAIDAGEHDLKIGVNRPEMSYEDLANAYKNVNRFADAKRVIAAAQAQGKDGPSLHRILFEIAMIEHDPETLHREVEWANGKPEKYLILEDQAFLAADEGKVRQAEDLFREAILEAQKEVPGSFSDRMLFTEGALEVQLGRNEKASELWKQVKNSSGAEVAGLQTRAGNIAIGEAYLRKPEEYPDDTVEHFIRVPELKAFVALDHKNPHAALAALAPAVPHEMMRADAIELHAEAYLAAGQAQNAVAEFQKLIANPGLESPMLPRTVIAHVGLARAYALEGNLVDSRTEYEKFFSLWQDADADEPILKQARLEFAHLGNVTTASTASLNIPKPR